MPRSHTRHKLADGAALVVLVWFVLPTLMVVGALLMGFPQKVDTPAPGVAVERADLACVTSWERTYLSDDLDTFVFACQKSPLDVNFVMPSTNVPAEVGELLLSKSARARAEKRGGETVGCLHEDLRALVSVGSLAYVHFCFLR